MALSWAALCAGGITREQGIADARVGGCAPPGTRVLLRTQEASIYRSSKAPPGAWTFFACRTTDRHRVPLGFAPVRTRAIPALQHGFAGIALVDDEIEGVTSTVNVGSFQTGKLLRAYQEGTGDCRYDTSGRCRSANVTITRLVLASNGSAAWLASVNVAQGSSATSTRRVETLTPNGHRVLARSPRVSGTFLRLQGHWVYWRNRGTTHRARLT